MYVYGATCDRRSTGKRRAAQKASNDEYYHAKVSLLVEASLNGRTAGSGSKVSSLSKMARSVLPVYAINWTVMCGTWSLSSCKMTA